MSGPYFVENAAARGIEHIYDPGPIDLKLMVQPTGGGCSWLDYDRDGDCDLYLNQGGDPSSLSTDNQPSDVLYRNRGGRFCAAPPIVGIVERNYGQGAAAADFDNDGFDDVFVTNAGPNSLFRNLGDGTFELAALPGLTTTRPWSSSCAWGDVDRDGDLDLYVCHYVEFDRLHPQRCLTVTGESKMCQPTDVLASHDEFYVSLGDGDFQESAHMRGLWGVENKSLGIAIADFDNDSWPDIYVANDATPNFLYVNRHDGTFVNMAEEAGCAVTLDGRAQASMGVAVGDYDRNGFLDLYLTHFEGEWNTLYANSGDEGYLDVTGRAGGVECTLPMVGFGVVMQDFNQDGRDDLLIANGHLDDPGHLGIKLAMPPQLFSFADARLQDVSKSGGEYFAEEVIGRGLATADYDNDGDLDVAIVHQRRPIALLRNDSRRGSWLNIEPIGILSNRRGIGTRVVASMGKVAIVKELAGGTTYCASNQPMIAFGFGDAIGPIDIEIRWPSGERQRVADVELNQTLRLIEPMPRDAGKKTGS